MNTHSDKDSKRNSQHTSTEKQEAIKVDAFTQWMNENDLTPITLYIKINKTIRFITEETRPRLFNRR